MKKIILGIVGAGNMAQAILNGLNGAKFKRYLEKENSELDIIVSDTSSSQLQNISSMNIKNVKCVQNNVELAAVSDYVLFAIKPQHFAEAAGALDLKGKVIISIMAGVTIEKITEICKENKVVRVMPNLNAKIGESVNTYSTNNLDASQEAFIYALLSSFGTNVKTIESKINAATGVAGSGPAFVFMFVKAFAAAAAEHGFSKTEALKMATETIAASAKTAQSSDMEIDDLITSVCSKGGTTIQGVNHLIESDFESIVKTAINKAIKRADELGKM